MKVHPEYPTALRILARLKAQGFQSVFAGGCVRDSLLGRRPKDLDIATGAPPEVVERSFRHTLAVGKAFGTIVVIEGGHNFEVTTFRKEGGYVDGRHPSQVSFTDIREDASRRDFTVNALFYDPVSESVHDFVGGVADLRARVLRTVGEASARFQDDRLRMLRAIRFVAQLGFTLDGSAISAIHVLRQELKGVSAERILNESKRLLIGPYLTPALKTLHDSGLAEGFFPEAVQFDPTHLAAFPVFQRWENAAAAVFLLANKPSDPRLRAWKASRESLRAVAEQVATVQLLLNPQVTRAQRLRAMGTSQLADVLVLLTGLLKIRGQSAQLDSWIGEFLKVATPSGELPSAFLNGQDLLGAGIAPGAQMGELLKSLYEEQLEGKIRSRAEALKRIKSP